MEKQESSLSSQRGRSNAAPHDVPHPTPDQIEKSIYYEIFQHNQKREKQAAFRPPASPFSETSSILELYPPPFPSPRKKGGLGVTSASPAKPD